MKDLLDDLFDKTYFEILERFNLTKQEDCRFLLDKLWKLIYPKIEENAILKTKIKELEDEK